MAFGATTTIGEAVVKVRADTASAETEIKSLGSTLGKAFAAVGAGVVVTKFLNDARTNAVNLREELSKGQVVFGQSAGQIEAFAKRGAKALGLAQVEVLKYAGTFGNLFTSMGLADDQSAQLSESLVSLGVDLASFNNTTVDESLNALRAGLAGETEPLKRFGVNLTEATLKAKAAELGLGSFTGTLPPAIRLQAAYAVIMEQTANAQGDFARTADGAANKARIASAQLQDLSTTVGGYLYPVWDAFLNLVTVYVLPMLDRLATSGLPAVGAAVRALVAELDRLTQPIQDFIATNPEPFIGALTAAIGALSIAIGTQLYGAIAATIPKLVAMAAAAGVAVLPLTLIVAAVAALGAAAVLAYQNSEGFRDAIDGLADGFQRIWAALQEGGLGAAFTQLGEELKRLGTFIREAAKEWAPIIWDATKRMAAALWEWVKDATPVVLAALWDFAVAVGAWIVGTGAPWLAEQMLSWANAFVEWVPGAIESLLGLLGEGLLALGSWIVGTGAPWLAEQMLSWAEAFGGWLRQAAIDLIPNLIELVTTVTAWLISDGLPALVTTLGQWAVAFAAWVPGAVVQLLGQLAVLYIQVASWIVAQVPGLLATFAEWAWAFVQWLPGALADLQGALGRFVGELVVGIGSALMEMQSRIGAALLEGTTKVLQWVLTIPSTISGGIAATGEHLIEAGRSIVRAIVRGISQIGQAIWDEVMEHVPTASDVASRVGGAISGGAGRVGSWLNPTAWTGGVRGPGTVLVGEKGPELVNLGTTSRVLNHTETAAAMAPTAGPGIVIEMHQPTFGSDLGSASGDLSWAIEAAAVGRLVA